MLEAAARSKRGEQDVALLIELATLIWKRLNQPDMAESFFRRVRKLDASNHDDGRVLSRVLHREERADRSC